MNMIRKGQVRWLPKGDIAGQAAFVGRTVRTDDAVIARSTIGFPIRISSSLQHSR